MCFQNNEKQYNFTDKLNNQAEALSEDERISTLNFETLGNIHSFESMGTVDGPGIRSVVFMQGCNLRCSYCHNPDTWSVNPNNVVSSKELIKKLLKFKQYYNSSGGGVTFSGGEPLMQPDFLLDMLKKCRLYDIHTAIDTSGAGHCGDKKYRPDYDEILKYTNLVLLDVKHVKAKDYKDITGRDMTFFDEFISVLKNHPVDIWIRAVIIPGINDSFSYINRLLTFKSILPNIKRFEVLPYHVLGVNKYSALGIKYRLEGVPPMDKKITAQWEKYLNQRLN